MPLWPIYIALVLVGLLSKRSSRIIDAAVVCFLVFLACTNATHADYPAYSEWYYIGYLVHPDTYGLGWYLATIAGHRIGLAYNGLAGIMTLVALLLLLAAISRLHVNRALFWALFLVFPALVSIVQVRQLLAIALVLLGFSFVYQKKAWGYLVFFPCILVAMAFHRTAVAFALLPLVFLLQKARPAVLMAVVLALVALSTAAIARPDLLIAPVFGDFMVEKYFSDFAWQTASPNIRTRIVGGGLLIVALVPILRLCTQRALKAPRQAKGADCYELLRFATCLSALGLCIIPLSFMSADVLRMHRYIVVFALTAFSSYLALPGLGTCERAIWKAIPLAYALLESLILVNLTGDFGWVTEALLTFTAFPPLFMA